MYDVEWLNRLRLNQAETEEEQAEKLSGADFDGDTAVVIPIGKNEITSRDSLKGLKDFDPAKFVPVKGKDGRIKRDAKGNKITEYYEYHTLKRMFDLQRQLNFKVELRNDENLMERFKNGDLYLAILDEIGEFTHELKWKWCWWKKSQEETDDYKVLEELVDIWHFVMSLEILRGTEEESTMLTIKAIHGGKTRKRTCDILKDLCSNPNLPDLMMLSLSVGYDLHDVYFEYLEKNEINFKRQENNY